jgi:hypothetical protein
MWYNVLNTLTHKERIMSNWLKKLKVGDPVFLSTHHEPLAKVWDITSNGSIVVEHAEGDLLVYDSNGKRVKGSGGPSELEEAYPERLLAHSEAEERESMISEIFEAFKYAQNVKHISTAKLREIMDIVSPQS